MARGFSGEVASVELMEQGVCNVVHGNTVGQRAAYARRLAAAGLTLLAAIVVCAALVGSSAPSAGQLAASKLYSATGWDAIYGGGGASTSNSDGWDDSSGSDNTGARTNSLHETWGDDSDSSSDDTDVDPDSAKNDVHWNAAGGATSKTALSDDSSADDASSSVAGQTKGGKASSSSGSSAKASAKPAAAKKGKPDSTDALLKLSQSFDKGMPQPKNRQEEKKQKAEQLANLLRIQKELTSDYKKVMAKGTGIKSVGKKMGLMNKATQTARLGGDPFDV